MEAAAVVGVVVVKFEFTVFSVVVAAIVDAI
jgi:hypothetical protein